MGEEEWTLVTRRGRYPRPTEEVQSMDTPTSNSFESLIEDLDPSQLLVEDTPEAVRGSAAETTEPALMATESTELSSEPDPNPKSTKSVASRVLRLLGRPVDKLQRRPERVQFKVDQDKSVKINRKSKKMKKSTKSKKRLQKKKTPVVEDPTQNGAETPTGPTNATSASTTCDVEAEVNDFVEIEKDYDEELTATCPTIDELQAAEDTIIGHMTRPNSQLADIYLPEMYACDEHPSPKALTAGHGLGQYPSLVTDDEDEDQRNSDKPEHRVYRDLPECKSKPWSCIYPQLQLNYQDLQEDTTKAQIVALQVIAGYLSVVMPERSRSFTYLFNHCTCLLTGVENHQHFRQQGEKAVRGILAVLGRLLDYVSSICYVSRTDEQIQNFYQDLEQSMQLLTPDQPAEREKLSNELKTDVLQIDTKLQVTNHLRQVILSSLHLCDSLGDPNTPSKPTNYRFRVVKSLPFHGLQVLVNMKVINFDSQQLSSQEPATYQGLPRYPIPALDHIKPLAMEIIRVRSQKRDRKSSSARLEQDPEEVMETEGQEAAAGPSATTLPTDTASYFVHCEGATVHVYGLVEIDPRILCNRLQQSHVSAPYVTQETEPAAAETNDGDQYASSELRETLDQDPDNFQTTNPTVESQPNVRDNESDQPTANPRKRPAPKKMQQPTAQKQRRLQSLRSASTQLPQQSEKTANRDPPGQSKTDQPSCESPVRGPMDLDDEIDKLIPTLTRLEPSSSEAHRIASAPSEVTPDCIDSDSITLRSIISNAVEDSRRSVRTWGPTLKPALILRTIHTKTPEREQARVKVKMELLAAENLFKAVQNRPPTAGELKKVIADAFTKYTLGQIHNTFKDAELSRAHRELAQAMKESSTLAAFYQDWLPKLVEIEEYISSPVLPLGLFQPGYYQQHYSLEAPTSVSKLVKSTTVFGQVRGIGALQVLKKVLTHLMCEHPKVRLQTEVCNSVALRSYSFTWCTNIPTTSVSSRATSEFSTCNSLDCMTVGGCLLRSSTLLVGVYDDPCLDLLTLSTRLLHCTLSGELRVLTETRDNEKEHQELVQSRLPFLTTTLTGNALVAPRHGSLEAAGEVPATTVCGTERAFGHSGTCLNVNFPPEVKDPDSPEYGKYLQRYSLLRTCLLQFGFTVIDHTPTGDMKVELSTITAAVASTFYQYVGLLVRGSPELASLPTVAFDDQVKLKPSLGSHKIPKLFSTTGSAPETITRGFVSRHSRRGIPSALWERFNKVAKSVYKKGPYVSTTAEAKILETVRAHLKRLPNPFNPFLTISERRIKLAELNTVLHINDDDRRFFTEHVFTPALISQTRQLCPLFYCCTKTCTDNAEGFKRFKEELENYRTSEASGDNDKVPTHWQEVFDAGSDRIVHMCDRATRLLDLHQHAPISTGLEGLSEGLRSPALVLHMQEGDWSYSDLLRLGVIFMRTVNGVYKRPSKTGRKPGTKYHPLVAAFYYSDHQTHIFVSLKDRIPSRLSRYYLNLLK